MKSIPPPPFDFATYIGRPETRYCERAKDDSLEGLYSKGYLPYSGAVGLQHVFYTARSARVVLTTFSPSSENRRIARKFDGHFKKKRVPFSQFTPTETFWEFCLAYFYQKHGAQTMPRARLETILNSSLLTTIVVYTKNSNPVAYVLEVEDSRMGHFWFSFYDLSYARKSLGLWLMLDCIRDAQARGLLYYYLGTVYGEKALYKLNFEPLEWWDETLWSDNIARLKHL